MSPIGIGSSRRPSIVMSSKASHTREGISKEIATLLRLLYLYAQGVESARGKKREKICNEKSKRIKRM